MTMAQMTVNGARLMADLSGALFWPDRKLLAVADLHLEKGSGFAASGTLLPPYDTAKALDDLQRLLRRYRPTSVICLGDSFHDQHAAVRLARRDAERLTRLTGGVDWTWIAGNHDPAPPTGFGGRVETTLTIGPLTFRHEAEPERGPGEVSGHFHPKASVRVRGRRLTGSSFVTDGRRLILPAFGAYTGGLDVLDPAIAGLFRRGFRVYLLGRQRIHVLPRKRLEPAARSPDIGASADSKVLMVGENGRDFTA